MEAPPSPLSSKNALSGFDTKGHDLLANSSSEIVTSRSWSASRLTKQKCFFTPMKGVIQLT
jgi:hypothetical protein